MKFAHSLIALSVCCLVGCSDSSTEPSLDGDWTGVRLHEGGAETYRDLTIEFNGHLVLEASDRGGVSPVRGLLAGERLETLTRLIGDLPLDNSMTSECSDSDYFLSVTRGGDVQTFRNNECEPIIAVEALRDLMAEVATDIDRPRNDDPGAVRVLASGTASRIKSETRVVVENRDQLLALLRRHDPNGLIALPPVDFSRQVVLGFFLGQRASGGFDLNLGTVNAGDGWIRIETVESVPGPGCAVTTALSQPFLLLAAERAPEGFLFDSRVVTRRCG